MRNTLMQVRVAFLCVQEMKQPRLKGSIHSLESLTTDDDAPEEASDSATVLSVEPAGVWCG